MIFFFALCPEKHLIILAASASLRCVFLWCIVLQKSVQVLKAVL